MDYKLERNFLNAIEKGENNYAFQNLISYLNTQEKRIDELEKKIALLEGENMDNKPLSGEIGDRPYERLA